jgi:DNA polymerase-3 subunit epsilon
MVSRPDPETSERFAAIDFETANAFRTSACSVGIVRVEGGRIVAAEHRLIRPPEPEAGPVFTNTWVHGITWDDVADAPPFGEVWPELRGLVRGVDFIAAHNAPFDRGVLRACCAMSDIAMPRTRFECTVKLARSALNIYPTKLHQVCARLGIALRHHHALSDAEACARIVLAARQMQAAPPSAVPQGRAATTP